MTVLLVEGDGYAAAVTPAIEDTEQVLAMVAAIAGLHQASLLLKDSEPGLRVSAKFY